MQKYESSEVDLDVWLSQITPPDDRVFLRDFIRDHPVYTCPLIDLGLSAFALKTLKDKLKGALG